MKKLAIVANGNEDVAIAIQEYFQNKNVELELLADVGSSNNYDLVACIHGCAETPNAINLHPSLLPAFDSENPVLDAFMYGAKVTGITVRRGDGRIIIQYPLLIGNLTHFDELQGKITEIEKKIYPKVIEKLLNDEIFDFDDLFVSSHGCGGCSGSNCGGCGKCH